MKLTTTVDAMGTMDIQDGYVQPLANLSGPFIDCPSAWPKPPMLTTTVGDFDGPTYTPRLYIVKDSGQRKQFGGGMVRDTEEGKVDYTNLLHGPMMERWATHLTKAKVKYPDVTPGTPNWTLAGGEEELARFRQSAFRHFIQWIQGDTDEDHAAAIYFNVNGAEYVKEKLGK